jgi:hypothetical protein
LRKGAEWLQGSVDRESGKSGNRKVQKQKLEVNAKRKSPSTTKKKASVKKKNRKAA